MRVVVALCFLMFSFQSSASKSAEASPRPTEGSASQKVLTLDNGLVLLLKSDPNYNKSAAAINVGVGSLANPIQYPGLAHFLEHMLFLGSKDYPVPGSFDEFLNLHQGYMNAYTAEEQTNYYFEVDHAGYPEALTRFSQFFTSPTFNPDFVERELNAVNAEHQKNAQQDPWRKNRVMGLLSKAGHPLQTFATGNRKTLQPVTRDVLLDFYKKYYSPDRMKGVLLSSLPLDKMEELALQLFQKVPTRKPQSVNVDSQVFDPSDLPRLVHMKSVQDVKEMSLIFSLPSSKSFWESKPLHVITFLLGHEGKGSLLSYLKDQGLATALAAGSDAQSFAETVQVTISLTDKGLTNYESVLEAFFAYVNQMKRGVPAHVLQELKAVSEAELKYRPHEEGGSVASHYAALMQDHPPLEILERASLYFKPSQEDVQEFLKYIQPANLNVMLFSRNQKTQHKETFYQAEYGTEPLSADLVKKLNKPKQIPQLAMPGPNLYMPSLLSLESRGGETPEKLFDDDRGLFWVSGDQTFRQPRANISFLIMGDKEFSSVENAAKAVLYERLLRESINEWNYEVALAGLNFSVNWVSRGYMISLEGFSDHILDVMRDLAPRLPVLNISEVKFKAIKTKLTQDILNLNLQPSYRRALSELDTLLTREDLSPQMIYDPTKKIDHLSSLTLTDMKSFGESYFKRFALEGLASGNLTSPKVEAVLKGYWTALSAKTLPQDRRIPGGKLNTHALGQVNGTTRWKRTLGSLDKNDVWLGYYSFGPRNVDLAAKATVLDGWAESRFFTQLRTTQQLGYIVNFSYFANEKEIGMRGLIQSSDYDALTLAKRVDEWLKSAETEFNKVSEKEFEELKESAIQKLLEKDKTIQDRHKRLFYEAIKLGGLFGYNEQVAKGIRSLKSTDVSELIRAQLSAGRQHLVEVLVLRNQKAKVPSECKEIDDVNQFKLQAPYL